MPIYVYECSGCKEEFEHIQGMNDKPLRICIICGEKTVKRVITAPAISFKGTGWTPRFHK